MNTTNHEHCEILEQSYRALDKLISTYTSRQITKTAAITEIAQGAGVKVEWLHKFARRVINDPGVRKVVLVHDFATATLGNRSTKAA